MIIEKKGEDRWKLVDTTTNFREIEINKDDMIFLLGELQKHLDVDKSDKVVVTYYDKEEAMRALRVDTYAYCIWKLYNDLRSWYKWSEEESISKERLWGKFFDIINGCGVNLDEI